MTARPPRPPLEAVLAIAAVSFAILAVEIGLTRSFSVLFRAPYVFLIVSGAIGGLGVGGLLVQWVRPEEERVRAWITGLAIALSLAIAGPVVWLFASPWGREWVSQAELWIVLLLPMGTFSIAGMLISLILRRYSEWGGFLYFIDLSAAALAAPFSVLLLDGLGGINTPLLLAVGVAAVALLLAVRLGRAAWKLAALLSLCLTGAVFATNVARPWIALPELRMPPEAQGNPDHTWRISTKPLFAELAESSSSHITRTDWTAVSRTDVVRDEQADLFYIYTDGDVPTQMVAWDGSLDSARREYETFIGSFPYRLLGRTPQRVLAVGSGGGLDVLLAKTFGAPQVDAVEINPSIPRVIRDPRFAGTYARIYQAPGVTLRVDEGRSYLQRSGKFDVIYFACAKTATTQTGGVALLDNNLYTVEAFRDYWRHLTDGGAAGLVGQDPYLIDRLLITAWTALRAEGVANPASHLLTAQVPANRMESGPYRYILVMRKAAWDAADLPQIRRAMITNYLVPIFVPHVQSIGALGTRFDPAGSLSAIQASLESQYRIPVVPGQPETTNANLSAVTDDRPFYADIAPGINPTVIGLVWATGIAVAMVLAVVLVIGLRAVAGGAGPAAGELLSGLLYFAMLGAGFMLVELALMQRFILLLGFPTRALSVSLCSLLVSSALGSAWAQRDTPEQSARRLKLALPVLVALLLGYRAALGPVLQHFLAQPLAVRVLVTGLLMFPAGFLMGMPFPTALRTLSSRATRLIPAFWSVNGICSIGGSVLTMVVAKFAGYGTALLCGAGAYALAWIAYQGLLRDPSLRAPGGSLTPGLPDGAHSSQPEAAC